MRKLLAVMVLGGLVSVGCNPASGTKSKTEVSPTKTNMEERVTPKPTEHKATEPAKTTTKATETAKPTATAKATEKKPEPPK